VTTGTWLLSQHPSQTPSSGSAEGKTDPRSIFLAAPRGTGLIWKEKGVCPALQRSLRFSAKEEGFHPSFIVRENGGSRGFLGKITLSQGGGGIQAQSSKLIIRKYSHKALIDSLKTSNSHCFGIPVAKGSPSKRDTKADPSPTPCLSFPI